MTGLFDYFFGYGSFADQTLSAIRSTVPFLLSLWPHQLYLLWPFVGGMVAEYFLPKKWNYLGIICLVLAGINEFASMLMWIRESHLDRGRLDGPIVTAYLFYGIVSAVAGCIIGSWLSPLFRKESRMRVTMVSGDKTANNILPKVEA